MTIEESEYKRAKAVAHSPKLYPYIVLIKTSEDAVVLTYVISSMDDAADFISYGPAYYTNVDVIAPPEGHPDPKSAIRELVQAIQTEQLEKLEAKGVLMY